MAFKPFERLLIFIAKSLKISLLNHAYIQLGISGFNNFENTGEAKLLQLLHKKYPKFNTLFDVGANDGSYSNLLATIFPDAQIYAFEPVPDTYTIAEGNLKNLKNVHLKKLGLYKESGFLDIYNDSLNPNDQISTLYPDGLVDFYTVDNLQKFRIEVKTLDTFCHENEINHIDFIKLDIEGAEHSVLEGAKELLLNRNIHFIQFEFNDFNISSRTFIKDFYKTLKGYKFFRINQKGLINMGGYKTDHEIFKYQNILAVSQNVAYFDTNEHIYF